jgi:hypothetical protein
MANKRVYRLAQNSRFVNLSDPREPSVVAVFDPVLLQVRKELTDNGRSADALLTGSERRFTSTPACLIFRPCDCCALLDALMRASRLRRRDAGMPALVGLLGSARASRCPPVETDSADLNEPRRVVYALQGNVREAAPRRLARMDSEIPRREGDRGLV